MRGHPILGGISGFLFGLFLGISLFLWGVVRLDSEWLVILPFVGLILGVVMAWWAPFGSAGDSSAGSADTSGDAPAPGGGAA
jgi:hypothetical protein